MLSSVIMCNTRVFVMGHGRRERRCHHLPSTETPGREGADGCDKPLDSFIFLKAARDRSAALASAASMAALTPRFPKISDALFSAMRAVPTGARSLNL
jgi:hypothetical protein